MLYKDKVVLVTGGASGIGKASVIEFAKEGAKVIFVDIQNEKAIKLKNDLHRKEYNLSLIHISEPTRRI